MDRQLLVADDDPLVSKSLSRFFSRSRRVVVAQSVSAAIRLLDGTPRWIGAIIDYEFPDGDGMRVLDAFRSHAPYAPVLMLTGHRAPDVINRACELGAQFVVKPAPESVLKAFAARLDDRTTPRELDSEVQAIKLEFSLSEAEGRLLTAAVHGIGRDALAAHIGVAESTIKSQVRTLVAKCGTTQLAHVVQGVWKRAASSGK